jgi:hypothetical protein
VASRPPVLFWLPTLLIGCVARMYVAASGAYPFYFMWDMDHVTTVDILLIGEGKLPMHVNHPGFGMYLVLHTSHALARLVGLVSVGSLGELKGALHPLLCMAELTTYLRYHTPLLAILMVVALWRMVVVRFEPTPLVQLLILLCLITQSSLLFQATLIRSELYSMFFWVVGVTFLLSRHRSTKRGVIVRGFGAGACLGVALLTKLQCIFCIGLAFAIDYWLLPLEPRIHPTTSANARRLAILQLVILFVTMAGAAMAYKVGGELATFTPSEVPSVLAFLLVLFGASYLKAVPHQYAFPVVLGLMLSPSLHLLVYADPFTSLSYLLTDLKMAFFRPASQSISYQTVPFSSLYAFLQGGLHLITFSPVRLVVLLLSGWIGFHNTPIPRRRGFLLLLLLVGVHYFAAIRLVLRDQLMQEVPVVLICLVVLAKVAQERERRSTAVLGIAIGALGLSQLISSTVVLKRSELNYHAFGWNIERFYTAYDEGGTAQVPYRAVISAAYGPLATPSLLLSRSATNYQRFLSDVRAIIWNRSVPATAVGVVVEGARGQVADSDSRFLEVPRDLLGSAVADLAAVGTLGWEYDPGLTPRDQGESLDQLRWTTRGTTVALIPRTDIHALLFLPLGETPGCSELAPQPTRLITTTKNKSPTEWLGYLLTGPCSLPEQIARQGLLVVKNTTAP